MSADRSQSTAPNAVALQPVPDRFKKSFKGKGGNVSLGAAGTGKSIVATRIGHDHSKRSRKRK